MERRLILDDNDLIMVVNKDVVMQIDENRGEMNRTEFVNFLIHSQLKECDRNKNYVSKEELYRVVQEVKEFLNNFIDFVFSLELARQLPESHFDDFRRQIRTLGSSES